MRTSLSFDTIRVIERERLALPMPDVLQIGPLQLQGGLVALLLACVLGFWLMRRVTKHLGKDDPSETALDKPIEELIFNAISQNSPTSNDDDFQPLSLSRG